MVKLGALSPALSSGPCKVRGFPWNVAAPGLSCGIVSSPLYKHLMQASE
jgi:hypothetical protein